MSRQFPREVGERAVRLVLEHRADYETEYGSIAAGCGVGAESLRKWLRQDEVDAGQRGIGACPRKAFVLNAVAR